MYLVGGVFLRTPKAFVIYFLCSVQLMFTLFAHIANGSYNNNSQNSEHSSKSIKKQTEIFTVVRIALANPFSRIFHPPALQVERVQYGQARV